jgi:hypothetical protein
MCKVSRTISSMSSILVPWSAKATMLRCYDATLGEEKERTEIAGSEVYIRMMWTRRRGRRAGVGVVELSLPLGRGEGV